VRVNSACLRLIPRGGATGRCDLSANSPLRLITALLFVDGFLCASLTASHRRPTFRRPRPHSAPSTCPVSTRDSASSTDLRTDVSSASPAAEAETTQNRQCSPAHPLPLLYTEQLPSLPSRSFCFERAIAAAASICDVTAGRSSSAEPRIVGSSGLNLIDWSEAEATAILG